MRYVTDGPPPWNLTFIPEKRSQRNSLRNAYVVRANNTFAFCQFFAQSQRRKFIRSIVCIAGKRWKGDDNNGGGKKILIRIDRKSIATKYKIKSINCAGSHSTTTSTLSHYQRIGYDFLIGTGAVRCTKRNVEGIWRHYANLLSRRSSSRRPPKP